MAMKNEKLLVDANDAFEIVTDLAGQADTKGAYKAFWEAARAIQKMPAAKAEVIVHGRWEDEYGGAFANPRFRCSVCKENALYRVERDFLGTWNNVQALTPRCPFCGAVLDGGKIDGQ